MDFLSGREILTWVPPISIASTFKLDFTGFTDACQCFKALSQSLEFSAERFNGEQEHFLKENFSIFIHRIFSLESNLQTKDLKKNLAASFFPKPF